MSAVQICRDAMRRFVFDGSAENPQGLVEVGFNPGNHYPVASAFRLRPFGLKPLSDVGKGADKMAFQYRTPPVGYVRTLTSPALQGPSLDAAHRRQRGRVAATGYVDPYVIRDGPPTGLLTDSFRFVP